MLIASLSFQVAVAAFDSHHKRANRRITDDHIVAVRLCRPRFMGNLPGKLGALVEIHPFSRLISATECCSFEADAVFSNPVNSPGRINDARSAIRLFDLDALIVLRRLIVPVTTLDMHQHGPVFEILHQNKGRALHIIDPFKVKLPAAVEKARLLADAKFPLILLGSTDYERFNEHMPDYVDAVKSASGLPVVLHFPPGVGTSIPMTSNADAVFLPAILNSRDVHFVWKSLLHTYAARGERAAQRLRSPEAILSAAFTFGADDKSDRYMATVPTAADPASIERIGALIRLLGFDMIYLYSRVEGVTPELCRRIREQIDPHQLLFVGGGVRSRMQVDEFVRQGADFVVFGGALENENWRDALPALLG